MSRSSKALMQDNRQTLIAVAMDLFQRQGYYATGLNEILSVAELPKGSLYHHFRGGKTDLAIACAESLSEQIVQYLQNALLQKQSYSELIAQLIAEMEVWLIENDWGCGSLFATLSHEAKPEDIELREAINSCYENIQGAIFTVLREQGLKEEVARELSLSTLLSLEGALSLSSAMGSICPLKNAEALLLLSFEHRAQ